MTDIISFTHSILSRFIRASLLFALLTVVQVGAISAQTTTRPTDGSTPLGIAPGAPSGSYALSGFDNVNLFNGNLNFALPLREIGARGSASYTMTLAIERHWTVTHQTQIAGCYPSGICWYSHIFYPTPAWWGGISVGYGPGVLMGRKASDTQCNPGTPNSSGLYNKLTRLTFTMPGGTEYEMIDKLTGGQIINNSNYTCYNYTQTPSRGRVFVTSDGSAATFISDTTIYDSNYYEEFYPTGYLMLRDGTRYRVINGLVDWMRDRNGNKLSFTYDVYKRVTSIKDSINRQVTVSYANLTSTYYDQISFNGAGGAPRTIRIWYSLLGAILKAQNPNVTTPQTYSQLFPQLNGASTSTTYNPYLASSVELPDGRSYQFKYNEYGEMARAVLPTGGAYEYDYAPGRYDTSPSGVVDISETNKLIYRRIVQRRVYKDGGSTSESRTTYGRPELYPNNPGYVQVDHLDSNGTTLLAREKHYFYNSALNSLMTPKPAGYPYWTDGREYKTEVLDTNGTTVLRRVDHTWEQRAPVSWWTYGASTAPPNDPRIAQTVNTLEPTSANQVAKQTFNYDQYNNQTDSYEYDYGSGAPAANYTRRTHTDYLTTNPVNGVAYDTVNPNITNPDLVATIHLRSLPAQTQVFGAGSVEKARTTYEYDNYAPDPPYNFHAALIPRAGISGLCDGSAQNCPNEPNFTDPNYQRRGNLTRATGWILATSTQLHSHPQYDISGNVVKTIDPRGNATTFAFADCFGIPDGEARNNIAPNALASQSQTSYAFATSGTNAPGHISYTQFDYYLGKPVDSEDANSVVSSGYYDDLLDRPSKMIIAANQGASVKAQRLFTYDDANKTITTRVDQNSFNDLNPMKSEILYDGLGRTTETRQYESSTDYIAVRQVPFVVLQDGANWLAASQTSNPFRPHLEQPVWTTSFLDALGQVVKVMTPDNAVVGTAYSGNRVLVTDQAGKQRLSTTNALSQLKEVWEIKAADSMTNSISFPSHPEVTAGYRTVYEYDTLDNLTKVTQDTDPPQNHQPPRVFVYDSLKRLTLATNPESGTITYSYDNNGNLLTKTDARGVTITYAYDALNRNTAVNYSDATPDILRQYDLAATNGKGRLNQAWQSGTITSATYIDEYDPMGRPLKQRQKFETSGVWSGDYQTQRLYNLAGGVKEQTYPSGRKVFYSYDNAGRTNNFSGTLGDSVNRTYATVATVTHYSPWGGLEREQFGTDIPLYHKQRYNNRGQLWDMRLSTVNDADNWNRGAIVNYYSLSNFVGGGTGTDTNGNLYIQQHWIPHNDQMSPWTMHQQNYDYDSLNRITWVGEFLNAATHTGAQHYLYDRWGNRRINPASWGTGINNKQFEVIAANNRLGVPSGQSGTMTYDPAGNLINDTYTGAGSRDYDAENRITKAWGWNNQWQEYNYNADGQRVRRKVNGVETWQIYGMDGELLAEYAASAAATSPEKEYGYRNGELLITAASTQACGVGYSGTRSWTATNPSLGHATGQQEGSNWAVYVGSHSPTAMVFGPYDSSFGQGQHTAQFWLMVDNNSGTDVVATIDVVTNYGSNNLAQRLIRRNEFVAANQWQVFTLEFNNPCFGLVESRVWWSGTVNMKFSQVAITATNTSALDLEWLVTDQLGTPRMVVNKTGTLAAVKRHDYLPFGEELYAGVSSRTVEHGYTGDGVRQKFTSKERDNETGLDYFLARYYSNVQGRFTSVDPENYQAMLDLSDPQSWNAYSYVNNNPLDRIDSDGRGFFKKLWNKLRWDVYGEDAEVEAEEQRRRQFLYDNSFTKDAQGNWQHVDFSHLSRDELWVAYGAWHDRAADPNTYRLTADELVSALPAGGAAPATGSTANRGPSGRVSTEKYLENNWDKATFGNVKKSIAYHVKQHVTRLGRKMSDVEYTQRALKAFADSAAKRTPATDKLGRAAVKVVSTEGSGLFTPHGKIIWFQPKF